MKISTPAAVKRFFQNPTLEMVYAEAFANAIDAGATDITIAISLKQFTDPSSLRIVIRDNGCGFDAVNYGKFSELMKKSDRRHKGLGRLVYLEYFKQVKIKSVFEGNKLRTFVFDEDFKGDDESSTVTKLETPQSNYSELEFCGFVKDRIYEYEDVSLGGVKKAIVEQFLPHLFALKEQGRAFRLLITLSTEHSEPDHDFYPGEISVTYDDLPTFETVKVEHSLSDLFHEDFDILYRFEEESKKDSSSFLCVDGRAIRFPLVDEVKLPTGVSATFLLRSDFFDSKTNDSRQGLALEQTDIAAIRRGFFEEVGKLLLKKFPSISVENNATREKLSSKYPHLEGMFPEFSVGLIDENKAISIAQTAFFEKQKELLDATELSDKQYDDAMTFSSRTLAEYVLYREKIIGKLESITKEHPEETIHNLIVPRFNEFRTDSFCQDIYRNNAWLLDDKYMGYQCVLSEQNLGRLIARITDKEEQENEAYRPDIALVFSEDVESVDHPVDVVVVEVKKKGIRYKDNLSVIEQLLERARRLVNYYPTKIQRMWFFGIVEFDKKLRRKMKEKKWVRLYSSDDVYSQKEDVIPTDKDDNELSDTPVPVQLTLLSFDALWKDAKLRNATFMKLLRAGIKKTNEAKNASAASS
jgi:hypothetical protein